MSDTDQAGLILLMKVYILNTKCPLSCIIMGVLSLTMAFTKALLAPHRPHKDAYMHVRMGAAVHPQ